MLISGIYPDLLKIAKVTPVFKSGIKSAVTNYRPISVLPFFNKLFEKIIYTRLQNYLSQHFFFMNINMVLGLKVELILL